MAENTKISWATHTWNPWVGCDKVSPACDSCYAEAWAKRAGDPQLWQGERRRTKTWGDPLKWNRAATDDQGPDKRAPSVFTCSLADFFDNHPAVTPWRAEAWKVIAGCQMLDWYLVTKRIPNVAKMLPEDFTQDRFGHVVIIITVVTQDEADRDIPRLLAVKARFPWLRVGLSIEPMLGPIDLSFLGSRTEVRNHIDALRGSVKLDWVICGGESGSNARPMDPAWARVIRDQCAAAGVPFHFKQWGAWHADALRFTDAITGQCPPPKMKVGPARSGRTLDGRTHDDGPRKVAA